MEKVKIDDEIELLLVREAFAPLYVELARDNFADLSQWLAWPPNCQGEADFLGFIRRSLIDYAEGKSMTFGILLHDKLVGNVSFNTINRDLKKVEIGYWLARRAQAKGVITRVCKKLIEIAFNELDMQKVQISAATGNLASRAVCDRLGMKLEGIITNAENLNGRIVDHAVYGLHRR